MLVSQKSQYALRAVFELGRHFGQGWIKISDIARAQAIPPRFLEVILNQLKQAGFVKSKRGTEGGYALILSPRELAVGQVLRFTEGPLGPVECIAGKTGQECSLYGNCAFITLWEEVNQALSGVYDNTTFQDLLDGQEQRNHEYVSAYSI